MTTSLPGKLREWMPLLPLLLMLAGTYWLSQQVQPLDNNNGNNRHDPDIIVNQFTATDLNENGTPHYLLSAEKVIHYADDDSTHLTEPRLSSFNPGAPPVHASAETGEVSSKGDHVYLRGAVKVVREANAKQSEMTFTTDYLHVAYKEDRMETDRPVTLTDAHSIVQATGLQYDNKTRVMNLLAEVRSTHEIGKR
ncbi:MAG: LPS export ABC transporter periplasmic protein LptC [Gallionellaceae bacterium]|jgi:lipopolysaccharide export system protein LptC|nr:LPS export ABC transporter periplasmic protein LptC [Gallionellaceae bacterium]